MRELLGLFPKPSHYAGIEDGSVVKDRANINVHMALVFPDTYEVGMSYLGHKILYGIINANPGWWAERVMAPGKEAANILKELDQPLCTLESDTPLAQLDALGFAVTHELCFTDVLHVLDLAGIPLRAKDRAADSRQYPLVLAGGGAMLGAEALVPFLDLVFLGDGEEQVPEVLSLLQKAKEEQWSRPSFLEAASRIGGVYIPSFFEHDAQGKLKHLCPEYRPARRVAANLDETPYPISQVMPVGAVHNRLALEIARGCTRGCRFCHAGMVYRPARERSPETLARLVNDCLDSTGFEEMSFLALSAGDYSALKTVWDNTFERCRNEQISLSLPSLRVGSVDDGIMAKMSVLRRTGCTLAPEAGSQRLRNVINKGIGEEDLLLHAQKLLEHGWRQVKLYFMIGLPTETDEDLAEIAALCAKVRDAGGPGSPRLQVTAALSPFVPKPFTPFQWEEQNSEEEIARKIALVRDLFKKQKSLTLRWHDSRVSFLEGLLSRADRRMADVVEKAYRKGAVYCGWMEFFDPVPWQEAMAECGLNPEEFTGARTPGEILPWSHIEAGVDEGFLLRERTKAMQARLTPDCRYHACNQCGSCDRGATASLLAKGENSDTPIKNRLVFPARDQISSLPQKDDSGRLIIKSARQERPRLNPELAIKAAHYKIWHRKTQNFAFLSNLELQAVVTRHLRRANLPVSFSQGFHPLPLLSFGRALPVGVESEMEWFAVTLHAILTPEEIEASLAPFFPPDLAIKFVERVEKMEKTEQAAAECFRLEFASAAAKSKAARCFAEFAARDEFPFTKKSGKEENIRNLLAQWLEDEKGISFTADWTQSYLSPLHFTKAILSLEKMEGDLTRGTRIIKTGQIFANGKKYSGSFHG